MLIKKVIFIHLILLYLNPFVCFGLDNLVVVTVATQITEGFLRFNRSVNLYGLKLEVCLSFENILILVTCLHLV